MLPMFGLLNENRPIFELRSLYDPNLSLTQHRKVTGKTTGIKFLNQRRRTTIFLFLLYFVPTDKEIKTRHHADFLWCESNLRESVCTFLCFEINKVV